MRSLFALIFLGLCQQFCLAQLHFEKPSIKLKPTPDQEEVTAHFKFTNQSNSPIKILSIDSTCSCLSAELDQTTYLPGQKGTGTATFKVSTFSGRQEKDLIIHTQGSASNQHRLPFVIDIPIVVELQPHSLQWVVGDDNQEKFIDIHIHDTQPVKILSYKATRDNIQVRLETLKEGKHYRLFIKPNTTEHASLGAVRLETDSVYPRHRKQLAFFNILSKEAAARMPKS